MKIYVAFRFTGEDPAVLDKELGQLLEVFTKNGHEPFCSFWKEQYYRDNDFTNKQIINDTLPELDSADALLAYYKSSEKSEGMLLEIGYALGKGKRLIVLIKEGVKTNFVADLAGQVISYKNFSEIPELLREIK